MSTELIILAAEDSDEDRKRMLEAWYTFEDMNTLYFVNDGVELMDYLRGLWPYDNKPKPNVILLDLDMPRKDGLECLKEIKADDSLNLIPVVMFTRSEGPQDIKICYREKVNSYIVKPQSHEEMIKTLKEVKEYWTKFAYTAYPKL